MTPQPNAIRAGIIGGGFMAATHARAIRAAGGTVAAVSSSSEAGALAARARIGAIEAMSTRDLLARRDIDVVHICTPNTTHAALAVDALGAGKQIVCEKPLATTAGAARDVLEAARTNGGLGMVPFVYRFHPMVREMRAMVADGVLGTESVIHGSYLQGWLASANETNWRVNPEHGGPSRAFADIGSHWFDLLEFVSGARVTRLSAQTSTVFSERSGTVAVTEDAGSVQFVTERGTVGTMVVSQVAAGRSNRLHLELSGSAASLAFDQEQPHTLWLGARGSATNLTIDADRLHDDAARLAFLPAGHTLGYQDAFNAFVADTYAVFGGTAPASVWESIPMLRDGLRAAQLCDAVLASAQAGGSWIATPAKTDILDFPATNPTRPTQKEERR